jgi:hypothetical protein
MTGGGRSPLDMQTVQQGAEALPGRLNRNRCGGHLVIALVHQEDAIRTDFVDAIPDVRRDRSALFDAGRPFNQVYRTDLSSGGYRSPSPAGGPRSKRPLADTGVRDHPTSHGEKRSITRPRRAGRSPPYTLPPDRLMPGNPNSRANPPRSNIGTETISTCPPRRNQVLASASESRLSYGSGETSCAPRFRSRPRFRTPWFTGLHEPPSLYSSRLRVPPQFTIP